MYRRNLTEKKTILETTLEAVWGVLGVFLRRRVVVMCTCGM